MNCPQCQTENSERADPSPVCRAFAEALSRGQAAVARHLDFVIQEFRDMKMQPSLERALKLRT